jgi:hypothetical protein
MRQLLAALGIVLLAAGYLSGQTSQPAQTTAAGTAALSGVVSDTETGAPMAGVSVQLDAVDQNQITRRYAVTDTRGRYVFVNLPSTPQYNLSASYAGYQGGYTGGVIRLAGAEWKRDGNISLSRRSWIGGRVVDERGEPVVGVVVRLFSRRQVAGHELLIQGTFVTTDDRGIYRFFSPPVGECFVAVLSVQATVPVTTPDGSRVSPVGGLEPRNASMPPGPPQARGASIDVDGRHRLVLTNFATPPPPSSDHSRAYAPVFYPSARVVNDAQPITVEATKARTDIDFQLTPIPSVTVSGQITGAPDRATKMLLRLMAPGTEHLGFGSEVATTLVEPGGGFTFLNVPSGTYTLIASSRVADTGGGVTQDRLPQSVGYSSATGLSASYPAAPGFMWWQSPVGVDVWGRLAVSVGAVAVTELELPVQLAATVRGHVIFDDPAPPDPSRGFDVTLEPANADPALGAPDNWVSGDASYAFTIKGLLGGRYLFRPPPFGGWRIKSVTARGVDITDTGVDGTLGQDFDDVVVTLTKAVASISGQTLDDHGQPAAGIAVLFSTDPKRWVDFGFTPDRLRSRGTGGDGKYSFTGLPGGDYYVIAIPPGRPNAWLDPKFLAAAVAKATKVTLVVGGSATQDVRLSEVIVK